MASEYNGYVRDHHWFRVGGTSEIVEDCKLCAGRNLPAHTKGCHFAVGFNLPFECEFITARKMTEDENKTYTDFIDHNFPWTLEVLTSFFVPLGIEVIWMRKRS